MRSTCRLPLPPAQYLGLIFLSSPSGKKTRRQKFAAFPCDLSQEKTSEMESQEIDLRLSLSLNGRFGLDPLLQPKKLVRSSSIPDFLVPLRKEEVKEEGSVHVSQMVRTYSLPTMEREGEEEECRKRKEMQSLRRMEVKRRRMEKQRNLNGVNMRRAGTSFREKSVAPKGEAERRELDRSGSSGVSSESDAQQGRSTCCETGVTATLKSLSKDEDHRAATVEPQFKQTHNKDIKLAEEMLRNVLEHMPCVSTKVDGPNGKRVEGFLYRYRKGEEIRIVCICHGQFLSPAEFVEHAGGSGTDITHPLKQIVVCPSW